MIASDRHGVPGATRWRSAAVRWVLGVATAVMIVWLAVRNWDDLRQIDLSVEAGWLVGAIAASFAATLLLAAAWRELIGGYGTPMGGGPALRVWMLSQATRFLPTGLVPIPARAGLAVSHGVNPTAAAASVVVEGATLVGWTAVFAAVWAPSDWLATAGGWAVRIVIGVAAAVGLVTLPWTLAGAGTWWRRVDRFMRRVVVLRPIADRIPPDTLSADRIAVWRATSLYGSSVALRLVVSVLAANALIGATGDDAWLVAGATAAGLLIGILGITPAGLGVREVVVAALLANRFGVGDAAAFVIAVRALEFAHELVLLPLATAIGRTKPAEATD